MIDNLINIIKFATINKNNIGIIMNVNIPIVTDDVHITLPLHTAQYTVYTKHYTVYIIHHPSIIVNCYLLRSSTHL